MSHVFTTRGKILLLVCAVLFVGIFYYEFAYKYFKTQLTNYDVTDIQTELDTEQVVALRLTQMQKYLDEHKNDSYGTVEPYNNLSNEVAALGEILDGNATDINIAWSEPTASDSTVRRTATVSFNAANYETARNIVTNIANLKYRCIISDIQLNSSESNMASSQVSVSLSVTFYETTEGATDTNGLVTEEKEK